MELFANKTVIISGGAEGIGLAIARAVGKAGMNVVLGDINATQLDRARAELDALGVAVATRVMDVTRAEDWDATVATAKSAFGDIHALVNNAGVGGRPSPIEATVSMKDWRWVVDVNLMGVVEGTRHLVPEIKAAGGGWIVNVASMAGLLGVPFAGAYTATKVAVVGLSEAWAVELAPSGIHVAALCPAFVQTRIHLSERNKPAGYLDADETPLTEDAIARMDPEDNPMSAVIAAGIEPDLLGDRVVEALRAGERYILTHPNYRAVVQRRMETIDAAFARAADSAVVGHLRDQPLDVFVGD